MEYRKQTEEYWNKASKGYSSTVQNELAKDERSIWTELINNNAPEGKHLNVLDIGTGPGFFAIIMSLEGHDVTGIDCTAGMLEAARINAEQEGVSPTFLQMDVHHLDFPDNTFDLIVSRNVVWTLYNPEQAFMEWKRVLKPGGRLLIFDGNWYMHLFNDVMKEELYQGIRAYREKHGDLPLRCALFQIEEYWKRLPLVGVVRPLWDRAALWKLGLADITVQENLSCREVGDDIGNLLYGNTPMFMVRGTKLSVEEEVKQSIREYWDGRAPISGVYAIKELKSGGEYYKSRIKQLIPKECSRILDVGCGAGAVSVMLAQDGYEVTAIDFSDKMLEETTYTAKTAGVKLSAINAEADNLPFSSNTFDAIVCKDVLWLLQEPEKAIKEFYRVLKSSGVLIIIDENRYLHQSDAESRKTYEQKWQKFSEQSLEPLYGVGERRVSMMDNLAKSLPLTMNKRPEADIRMIEELGLEVVSVENFDEMPTQISSFTVVAVKRLK